MKSITALAIILFLLLISIPTGLASVQVVASNTLISSNDSIRSIDPMPDTSWHSIIIMPNVTLNITGSQRFSFDCFVSNGGGGATGRCEVFKNGVAYGISHNIPWTGGYTTFTENITGSINTTDIVDLKAQVDGATMDGSYNKNFRLMYDSTGYNISTSGNVTTLERINWSNDTNSIYLGGAYNPQTINQFFANITSLSTRSDPYQINQSGLIFWSHYDDNTTDLVTGNSGTGFNSLLPGTLTGFNLDSTDGWNSSGYRGGGLKFDGTNDYINVSGTNSWNGINKFSIGTRIKWLSIPATEQSFFNKYSRIRLSTEPTTGYIRAIFYDNGSAYTPDITLTWKPTLNQWYDIEVVYNGTVWAVWINGAVNKTQAVGKTLNDAANMYWMIGGNTWQSEYSNVILDDPHAYDIDLTPTEIGNIHNSNVFPTHNLTFLYQLNETTGATAHNCSGISYIPGKFNNALNSSASLMYPSSSLYNITSNITVEGWLKWNGQDAINWQEIVSKRSGTTTNYGFAIPNNGNQLAFYYYDGSAWQIYTTSDANIPLNKWTHVAVTYQFGTGSTMEIIVNNRIATGSWTTGNGNTAGVANNIPLVISGLSDGTESFNGLVDEIIISNVTKNLSELNLDYYTRLEQLRLKSENTNTWSGYWNSSSNNNISISYDSVGSIFSYVNLSVPTTVIQNNITIFDFNSSSLFKLNLTIDGLTTPSALNFISPTKLDSSEAWNVRNTTIRIQGNDIVTAAILRWWSDNAVNHTVYTYQMNQENNTVWSYNFTNLIDDKYHYNVTAMVNGSNVTTQSHTTIINLGLSLDYNYRQIIFRYQNITTNKYASFKYDERAAGTIPPGWTMVEPEIILWNVGDPHVYNSTTIKRCYNSTTDIYWDNPTSCGGDTTSATLGVLYGDSNINSVAVTRYYKAATGEFIIAEPNGTIPAGFAFNTALGFAMKAAFKPKDVLYINNSKIRVGFDMTFGGAIAYLSENSSTKNVINTMADPGRYMQNAYYDNDGYAPYAYCVEHPGTCANDPNYYVDWNPILAGDIFGNPATVVSSNFTSTSATIVTNMTYWNPSHGNDVRIPPMQVTAHYSFDGENPVLITKYTYQNLDNINHPSFWIQEVPSVYLIDELFSNMSYYHEGGYNVQVTSMANYGGDAPGFIVFGAARNVSGWGVGIYQIARPRYGFSWSNGTYMLTNDTYAREQTLVSPRAAFGIGAAGTNTSTGTHIARTYLGNLSQMTSYFLSLDFAIDYDTATPENQSVENNNSIYIQVNSTETAKIQSAFLQWTNQTGSYNISMSVNQDQLSASVNMSNLPLYNYSYYVNATATTGSTASTGITYTELIDTLPPASNTNLQNVTDSTYINWTWTDPADADFDHVETYLDGIFQFNVTKGIQYFNATGLIPLTSYTIGTHTVDTSGNVNTTWMNNTAMTNNNPPNITFWGNNKTNDQSTTITINVSELVKFNATANQTITTWSWFKDSINQSTNYDNITLNWSTSGRRNVSINGSNVNGTTQIQYWTIEVRSNIAYRYDDINDSYVQSSAPTTNYGNSIILIDNNPPNKWILINFSNISGYTYNQIASASFNFYLTVVSGDIGIQPIDSDWSEDTVNWNNKPTFSGNEIHYSPTGGGWVSVDITQFVKDWINGSVLQKGVKIITHDGDFGHDEIASRENVNYNASYIQIALKPIPAINYTWNSINGFNQTALTLNVGNSATFNVSSNQSIDNWSWKINGAEQQNTSSNQFTKLFDTLGSYNVTIQGFNINGSTDIRYTVVAVQTSGGSGTVHDWLDGHVNDSIGNPVNNVLVQTIKGSTTTNGAGYYQFGYVFDQGTTYNINFSKSGYNDNNQSLLMTTDHMILNIVLSQISPTLNFNVSGYVLNQSDMSVLPGASVSSPGLISNISDNTGFWIIRNVTNGTKTFTAHLTNYSDNFTISTIAGADLFNQNITLVSMIPTPTPAPSPTGNVTGGLNQSQVQTLIDANNSTMFIYGLIGGILGCYVVLKKKKEMKT